MLKSILLTLNMTVCMASIQFNICCPYYMLLCSGLVSGHILAELVQSRTPALAWYRGQLLNMAVDCATRLLPAFNSSTGLPYPRVNLRTGLQGVSSVQQTCTACAGSMILEFAALSRLTGEPVFEKKVRKKLRQPKLEFVRS